MADGHLRESRGIRIAFGIRTYLGTLYTFADMAAFTSVSIPDDFVLGTCQLVAQGIGGGGVPSK